MGRDCEVAQLDMGRGTAVNRSMRPARVLQHDLQPAEAAVLKVPADAAPAEAVAVLVAWVAALPSPLLPASAARIAEQGGASLVAAEELLADVLAPPAWAILRYLLRECSITCPG